MVPKPFCAFIFSGSTNLFIDDSKHCRKNKFCIDKKPAKLSGSAGGASEVFP